MQPQLDPTTDAAFASFLPGMPQEDDKALIIRFFVKPKLMGLKSREAGREIYEDREYIEIVVKGQDKQIVVEEVKPHHRDKYPIAYHQFQMRKPAPVVGTPIEQLPGMGPSMAHHLKGLNLRSVEDVANVTDENTLQRMGMGARELVRKAQAWVEQKAPETLQLRDELERERAERDAERKAFEERLAALETSKKPGRKKKQAEPAA